MVLPVFLCVLASDKDVYPLSVALPTPRVEIDVSDFPEGNEWALKAKSVVTAWYSHLTQLLATDGVNPVTGKLTGKPFKNPTQITIVLKKEISAPAWASGDTITVNGKWITQHPEDLGMMIHELTHVIQQYDQAKEGWLVEGIADYIRWWRYEPELHATKNRTKVTAQSKYTDAYRTTAVWLAWGSQKYDRRLVPALDFALRNQQDPMEVFKILTGKNAQELWDEFVKEQV